MPKPSRTKPPQPKRAVTSSRPVRSKPDSAGLGMPFLFPVVAALLLACAIAVAYANTYAVPFLLDDEMSIGRNASIRHLNNLGAVLWPRAGGETVAGRPLLNLTLALNYALGGMQVRGYHVFNLLLHMAAALALFGCLRRMLGLERIPEAIRRQALPIAFATVLIWALHPLQTQSVTYIIQRAESLVSLFYLLTLYCFLRAVGSVHRRRWYVPCFLACLLGMGCKEVMVSAPLLVLLLDRTFVSSSFGVALRARRGLYIALFATWIPLAALVATSAGRGGTVGSHANFTPLTYAGIQAWAIPHYLRLALWPRHLLVDYGTEFRPAPWQAALGGVFIAALLGFSVFALLRRWRSGFVLVLFVALLAPSSSFIPIITEIVAEHRMYLPLAACIVLPVIGLFRWLGARALPVCLLWAVALGVATHERNRIYQSPLSVWSDCLAHGPVSSRTYCCLGYATYPSNKTQALDYWHAALRIRPDYPEALSNLGGALTDLQRPAEALPYLEKARQLNAANPDTEYNLGCTLLQLGRADAAVQHFEAAIALGLLDPLAECNLGVALTRAGRPAEALQHFASAVQANPSLVIAENAWGAALATLGRLTEARPHFVRAVQLQPGNAEAQANLAALDAQAGRAAELPMDNILRLK